MASDALKALCAQKRTQLLRLREVAELTKQIAEAAERRDELAMEMLLGERETPLRAAYEIEIQLRESLEKFPEAEAIRLNALLRGAEAETEEEAALAELVAQYRRLMETTIAADKRLSLRLGGKNSFYELFAK
ncbi:MAG: hypothetical protein IKN81_00680 [Oscillospiraceae bacterium]|nr:hypothetical protein [Oscillospiraceae bacterium]